MKPTVRSKATIKVWILIYLCDVSKALHTEVLETCSGPGMVNALRTVFAIRNTPHKISADPGKNFINARNRMSAAEGSSITKKDLLEVRANWPSIKWIIHPTAAPWRNRAVEAFVKQVKSSLKCLPTSHLSSTEFRTVLGEITT